MQFCKFASAFRWHHFGRGMGNQLKPTKNKTELAMLVAAAIEAVVASARTTPPVIEAHIRDGLGRNWDVSVPAPSPIHRRAIDSVRDLYDLT